ncbi:MAG: type II toxin-antitoxin system RelE/ParE family toxin [Alphaproteobacteria bacterium]
MKIVIKATKTYEKDIFKILSLKEREDMEYEIASNPLAWPVIAGSGGVRKARFSRGDMGKRSGGRVCYLYLQVHSVLYMLKAYTKNDQEDLLEKEKKQIKKIVEQIREMLGG